MYILDQDNYFNDTEIDQLIEESQVESKEEQSSESSGGISSVITKPKGCKNSVAGVGILGSLLTLVGAVVVIKKNR